MGTTGDRLDRALKTAGVTTVGIVIGDDRDKTTWKVQPASLQTAAQPIIDAFNSTDPTLDQADLDVQIKALMDDARIYSAILWTILDTYSEFKPATPAKLAAARTKIIAAFKSQPWKP